MSIRIEIIDPTIKDEKMLVATARFLMEIAGHQMVPAPVEVKAPVVTVTETLEIVDEVHAVKVNKTKEEVEAVLNKTKRKKKEKVLTNKEIDTFLGKKLLEVEPILVEEFNNTPPFFPDQVAPPYAHCAAPIDAPPPPVEILESETPQAPFPIDPPKIDFNSLIAKITKLTDEKKLENADVLRIVRAHGLDKTHYLSTNPHLIEAVSIDIDRFAEGK